MRADGFVVVVAVVFVVAANASELTQFLLMVVK